MAKTTEPVNRVVTQACLEGLVTAATQKDSIQKYRAGKFSFSPGELLLQPVIPEKTKIALNVANGDSGEDSENAARIYEALSMLTESDASDTRLWTYLSHGPLAAYMSQRWEMPANEDDASNVALRRWLFHGDGRVRAISRNGLSRLWWGAHLTKAPWEIDEFFLPLKSKDPFAYTHLLFEYQDVYEGLMGRSLGRDRHILICTLELLRRNKNLQADRESIRAFLRRLNLECFHTLLGAATLPSAMKTLERCIL